MNNLNDTLPDLMRRATDGLEPESTDLVERGMRRGLILRRRRTALLSFSAAGAVLATVGIVAVGTQLFASNGGEAPAAGAPAQVATKPASTPTRPATLKDTLATLQKLLPANLQVSKPQTWGGGEMGMNGASVVVNDGKGASQLLATVGTTNTKKTCADAVPGTCKVRPDGSVLVSYVERPTYPNGANPGGVISNAVEVYRTNGTEVTLMSLNGPQEKDAEHTRAKPVFSAAALTQLADSTAWGFPARQPVPTGAPVTMKARPPFVPLQATLATLKNVLPGTPQLTKPQTWGGGNEGFNGAAYVINDGKGASRVDVMVTTDAVVSKCPAEGLQHCKVRSDGSVLTWSKDAAVYPPGRNIDGVVSNVITINYPDGRYIGMTSYNAPQEKGAKHTRVKPAYTVEQLTAMADSNLWKFPGGTSTTPTK